MLARLVALAGLVIASALLTGCAIGGVTPPSQSTHPDIRGTVTQLDANHGSDAPLVGALRVEGMPEKDTNFDKAGINVTKDTRIYRQLEGQRTAVSFDALRLGQLVEATFTGPVLMSYPVQATASVVVILAETAPTFGVDIRGAITQIGITDSIDPNIIGVMRVEGSLQTDTRYDSARITIRRDTRISQFQSRVSAPATFNDLKLGQRVEVSFTGDVLQSYPAQATAAKIVILGA
jgi:hypothetical protein